MGCDPAPQIPTNNYLADFRSLMFPVAATVRTIPGEQLLALIVVLLAIFGGMDSIHSWAKYILS